MDGVEAGKIGALAQPDHGLGDVLRKPVKFLTAAMYPRCVQAVKPRTSMSSIMRWRNGLMALSVIGLLSVFELKVLLSLKSQHRADPPRYSHSTPTARTKLPR